jgi:tetratricopeptide (TPR) repeat protein
VVAGIGASLILGSAVVLREIFLRKARNRYLQVERKLDYNVRNFPVAARLENDENKLTLEKNAAIIKEIQKKSQAARVLGKISSGHLEVFEICSEYLSVTEQQMETVKAGSPRIAGIRRGREIVGELHRFHLLSWAEIESRSLTQKAKNYATISEKLNTAQEALTVLDSALQFYPNEPQLTASESALKDFIASIKVSHWIEQAERAAFKGNYKRAISLYRDALFFLAREDVRTEDREAIADKINSEIESLRELSAKKELNNGIKERYNND